MYLVLSWTVTLETNFSAHIYEIGSRLSSDAMSLQILKENEKIFLAVNYTLRRN
jgi:hypothetical protein